MNAVETISVLLSVYKNDKPEYLKKSVESILSQKNCVFHVFIGVDGPVGDELQTLINGFTEKKDIEAVWFAENRGLSCVLNDLVALSKKGGYTYYARMDADDVAIPDRFEKQMMFLEEHPDVDVVGGAIDEIDGEGKSRGKHVEYPLTHEECRKFFRYRDPLAHPAVMFRARYFEKVASGYRNEYRKNQDTMLWFDGFMNGCIFANLPETVLYFRITDDFYKSRRNGWARAKKMLTDRFMINHSLHYDVTAYLFSFAMFIMTLTPAWLKKIAYKVFR